MSIQTRDVRSERVELYAFNRVVNQVRQVSSFHEYLPKFEIL